MAIFFLFKKNNGAKRSEAILNWIAMSTFELKTHQVGRTYSNPHFFILNRAERKEIVQWTILVKEPAGGKETAENP
ncbi:hypothetical protein [Winogradskyella sp. PC D3.3]